MHESTTFYAEIPSPIGPLSATLGARGLTGLYLAGDPRALRADFVRDDARFDALVRELDEYFSGKRTRFETPLAPEGTPFELAVWRALCEIPCGSVSSYGVLAGALDKPGAARAVGRANAKNPISILIPCHRVIGRDGSLTGYAGGLPVKRWLLEHEASFHSC